MKEVVRVAINTISRKPNFLAAYPTKETFEEARRRIDTAALQPKSARFYRAPDGGALAKVLESGRVPERFSIRALSDAILAGSRSRILSEHDGAITKMLITVPRSTRAPNHVDPLDERHFRALLQELSPQTRYVIVHSEKQRFAIESWLADAGILSEQAQFVSSPVFNYSIWAQDAYTTLADSSGTTILCEGISFPRYEDMTIADDVAAQTDVTVLQSYLYFQGGNVLGGNDVTLMGMDYISRNVSRFGLANQADVVSAFERLWGTAVLPLGGFLADYDSPWWQEGILSGYGQQPLFHIDMYVTPTGVTGESGKQIVFLGSPAMAREIVGRWNDANITNGEVYNSFFMETERQLATRFEVHKLPLWLVFGNLNQHDLSPSYYVLTWNNAVVQNAGSTRKVLLPHFAEPQDCANYAVDVRVRAALQEAAEAQWRALHFDVARMDGLEDLAYGLGSVHCMTKALQRS